MSTFDRFVFVDWSANSTPKTGKDSIWVAEASTGTDISLRNPSTREAATRRVLGILRKAVEQRQRVLVGFDFAYSYPLPVLRHLASSHGPADFTDLWEAAHSRIQDSGDNSNDRYSFAAWANEHWFKEHYYWGFPSRSHAEPWLLGTRTDTKLPEFRLAESNSPGTQPTRKLAYSGSVGSQTLLGMRRLYELRHDPVLCRHSRESEEVWTRVVTSVRSLGSSGFLINKMMGCGRLCETALRAVLQARVGASCASTGAAASIAPAVVSPRAFG